MSFWTCGKCTFVNEAKHEVCKGCGGKKVSMATTGKPEEEEEEAAGRVKWGCRACTFLNSSSHTACDMCGTPKSHVSYSARAQFDSALEHPHLENAKFWPLRSCSAFPHDPMILDTTSSLSPPPQPPHKRKPEDHAPAPATAFNSILKELHLEKTKRIRPLESGGSSVEGSCSSISSSSMHSKEIIVYLTYNVWFREDLELIARMRAIGDIVQMHKPHFICFQEVTPNIFGIFQQSAWWGEYKCSVNPAQASKRPYFCIQLSKIPVVTFQHKPFPNTIMGRELSLAEVNLGTTKLVVATTHLESPCPAPPTWDQLFSQERVLQAKVALSSLKDVPNVIFGGDMNWDDKIDGAPPLPHGWSDAWLKLKKGQDGWTYDCKENPMLTGGHLRKRLDRIFCHLQDFQLESIDMVGTCAIPGLTYEKEKKVKKQLQKLTLPVLPSDHFGLLLKISPK